MTIRRAVIDAHVWVSAAGWPGSVPDRIVGLVRTGDIRSILTEELIDQVTRRLVLPPFNLPADVVSGLGEEMKAMSELVVPTFALSVIVAKESDNRVLEAAVAGQADAIITGDRRHLIPLGHYKGIPILSPADFLAVHPPDSTPDL